MAFFEEIGKRLTNAGQNVAQQTKNLADVAQLNSAISDKEKKISQLFLNIGQLYYQGHKNDPSAEHREIIGEIDTLYEEIAQNQEKIKQIKGVIKCPNCGASVPLNAAFCNACGTKITRETTSDVNESPRICPACHAPVGANDSFCNNCGTKVEN